MVVEVDVVKTVVPALVVVVVDVVKVVMPAVVVVGPVVPFEGHVFGSILLGISEVWHLLVLSV